MCFIVSNTGTLHYSAVGTFIDKHEAIFRLNPGHTQPQSDVRASPTQKSLTINWRLWTLGMTQYYSGNLDTDPTWQKTQHQLADQGVAFIPFPHQHNGLHGHTYKNGLQRRFIHIHQLQDFLSSSLFPTSAQWWHLPISTCMSDWACVTTGLMNAMQHAIWDIGILLVGKRLFIAAFAWTQKGNYSHSWC
jgi:hypothetical protein